MNQITFDKNKCVTQNTMSKRDKNEIQQYSSKLTKINFNEC